MLVRRSLAMLALVLASSAMGYFVVAPILAR
jgi:hypothetical protein